MTQHSNAEHEEERPKRRRLRGLPAMNFEQSLALPKAIMEHSIEGEIQRLTLFEKLGRSPDSGPSRGLIANSSKYGLVSVNSSASSLSLTNDGQVALSIEQSPFEAREKQFQLAIKQFEPFNDLYEKLKGRRFPSESVLKDEIRKVGVDDSGLGKAAEIFTANLRFLGLIYDLSGRDYVRPIEQVLGEESEKSTGAVEGATKPPGTDLLDDPVKPAEDAEDKREDTPRPNLPELHVDIQIHIDSTASSEQIDQIFASMARHLYGRESN